MPGFAGRRMNDAVIVDRVRSELKRFLAAEKKKGALVVEDDALSGGFACDGLVVAAVPSVVPK